MAEVERPRPRTAEHLARWDLLAVSFSLLASGCFSALSWVGVRALYDPASLPESQIARDIVYAERDEAPQRLDLYRPRGQGWPAVVFVYGGGWDSGDKALRVAGADVYGNIGRFFAARGIGVAVVNYRLQPRFTWREQVDDVAAAVAWVRTHVAEHGGDADAIFLAGHSAGAQLASYVALNTEVLARHGLARDDVRGVIAVSAAGLDLVDRRQFQLGARPRQLTRHFRTGRDSGDGWRREASATTYARADAPPFLFLWGTQDPPWVKWQMRLLHDALRSRGARSEIRQVAGENHYSVVLALSRDGPGPDLATAFIRAVGASRSRARQAPTAPPAGEPASPR